MAQQVTMSIDNKKIIVITGQTGSGKTALAVQIAKKQKGYLLSADSRQVYKQMDIGTGKVDSPEELEYKNGEWEYQNLPIFGINLAEPDQTFSAGDFAEYATNIISQRDDPCVLVGGTGFYIKSLLDPDPTIAVPQNPQLRQHYAEIEKQKTVSEYVQILQHDLSQLNEQRLERMNNSDRNNPRRLLRAIEVAQSSHQPATQSQCNVQNWIGLFAPKDLLELRIRKRVEQMIENGLEEEIKSLLTHYSWETPGLQSIGYIEWKEYLEGKVSKEQLLQNIVTSHLQYARKQMIYLKRFPQIKWFDISQHSLAELTQLH